MDALDGKNIVIRNAPTAGSDYNYKVTYRIVLLALVDADYCFTFIDVGAQGRTSVGGIFQEIIYLMKIFSKRNLPLSEIIFNYRLSRARRIVEIKNF